MSRQVTKRPSALFVLASLILFFPCCVPTAWAQNTSPTHYWVCHNVGPNPLYLSGVINHINLPSDPAMTNAFSKFLEDKYNLTKVTTTCVRGDTEQSAQNILKNFMLINNTAVLTGWIYVEHATPAAAAPSQPAAATGGMYFVCLFDYYKTHYISGVNGPYGSDSMQTLANTFRDFLRAKYSLANAGSAMCVYQFSAAQAQALLNQHSKLSGDMMPVLTGWKLGDTAAPVAASASPAPSQAAVASSAATPAAATAAPGAAPAPTPVAQASPVSATIVMRLVDPVNSASDLPGTRYRGVVTQATTAGSVSIPVSTLAGITVAQSGGIWSAQLSSLTLAGRSVGVTSSTVSATSPVPQAAQKVGSVLSGLGGFGKKVPAPASAATAIASGDHVLLPPGTILTFTASVPQPQAPASPGASAAPSAAPAITAAAPVAPASTASPASVAPQAVGAASVMCFQNGQGKMYVTSVFDAPKEQTEKDKADLAFRNYVYTHFDQYPGNSGCAVYPSAAKAQQTLQIWKSQMGAKIVETGWVYKGPEPGPFSNPATPGQGPGK